MAAVGVVSKLNLLWSSALASNVRKCVILKHNRNIIRKFSGSSALWCPAHDAEFEKAKQRLNSLKEDPGNEAKLKIYGLFKQIYTITTMENKKTSRDLREHLTQFATEYPIKNDPRIQVQLQALGLFSEFLTRPWKQTMYKQNKEQTDLKILATVGKCNAPKPGMMDLVGKVKWNAWNDLGSMSQDDAQKAYIGLVNQLAGSEAEAADASVNKGPGVQYEGLKITRENKIFQIQLNRPAKKNAITWQMYSDIGKALKEAAEDDAYSIAVLTGTGEYYCSGNDLSNFTNVKPDQIPQMASTARDILEEFVNAFVDFPKPLISLVNGPAVGISVTTLGLCDAVYCTDRATFHTPFSALGQAPEACSSYLFPKIMGYAKANELLLFNRKITAAEAKERSLVSDVFPDDVFQTEAANRIQQYAKFPPQSMRLSKVLNRSSELKILKEVNKQECKLLEERWQSKECLNALAAFFSRKS